MIKNIDFDGFTKAEIVKIYDGGTILCNLLQIIESEDGLTEQIVKEEKNISFDGGYWPFVLSVEELKELCPEPMEIIE